MTKDSPNRNSKLVVAEPTVTVVVAMATAIVVMVTTFATPIYGSTISIASSNHCTPIHDSTVLRNKSTIKKNPKENFGVLHQTHRKRTSTAFPQSTSLSHRQSSSITPPGTSVAPPAITSHVLPDAPSHVPLELLSPALVLILLVLSPHPLINYLFNLNLMLYFITCL